MDDRIMTTNEIHPGSGNNKPTSANLNVTDYVSASRLKLWLKCPLAYKLRYVDRIVTPTTPSLFLGRIIHRLLEYFYRYRQRGVTLFPEVVVDHIKRIWSSPVDNELLRDRPQINYRTDIGGFLMDQSQLVDAGCTSYQWIGIEV